MTYKTYGDFMVISYIIFNRDFRLIIAPMDFTFSLSISENLVTQWDIYSGSARTAYHWHVQLI